MSNEYDGSNPTDDEIVAAAARHNQEEIMQAIANMSEGEIFLYSATYNEKLVIQEDELHLMFCYHGEMHKAKRDYGQDAYALLSEMYNNGASLDLPTDLRERIKAIVDAPLPDGVTADILKDDWLSDDNIAKMRAQGHEIIEGAGPAVERARKILNK